MSEYIDEPCPCTGAGFCPHYGRELDAEQYETTRRLDETGKAYRRAWALRKPAGAVPGAKAAGCGSCGTGPSVWQQAVNFTGSLMRHVAAGMPNVTEEEKSRRMSLCVLCEHYSDGRCAKCGCFLASKASWALEKCPVGKW